MLPMTTISAGEARCRRSVRRASQGDSDAHAEQRNTRDLLRPHG
jgi:hypothetical protein